MQGWDQADIFAVPLLDGTRAIGQVIDRAGQPDGVALCLFTLRDDRTPSAAAVPVALSEVISILHVRADHLDTGIWEVLGFEMLPRTRHLVDDRKPPGDVVEPPVVEAFLNACHGHYPWNGFPDPSFFDFMLLPGRERPATASFGAA